MTYPVFDEELMPFIIHPMTMTQEPSQKFLGYKAVTGERSFTMELDSIDRPQSMKLFYEFWKNECKYGTTPFLLSIPFFDEEEQIFLVKFSGNLSTTYNTTWSMKQKLIIVGIVANVIDDNSNYIVDDNGNHIVIYLNKTRKITWN